MPRHEPLVSEVSQSLLHQYSGFEVISFKRFPLEMGRKRERTVEILIITIPNCYIVCRFLFAKEGFYVITKLEKKLENMLKCS